MGRQLGGGNSAGVGVVAKNAAEAVNFCIKPLTHYLSRSDLKIGGI